jgi:hypothetical protein
MEEQGRQTYNSLLMAIPPALDSQSHQETKRDLMLGLERKMLLRGKVKPRDRVASLTLSRGSKSHSTHLYKLSNCGSPGAFVILLSNRETGAYGSFFMPWPGFTGAPQFPAQDGCVTLPHNTNNTAFA